MKSKFKPFTVYLGVFFTVIVLDFLSKEAIIATMKTGESIPVLGDIVRFTFVRNPGAAFSMGESMTWTLSLVAVCAVVGITVFVWTKAKCRWWLISLGLIAGGAAGNLIDRVFREPSFMHGHVVDFIQVINYPGIFNLADSAIVVGAIMAVILVFKEVDYAKA